MLRTLITKKSAWILVTTLALIAALVTVWPLRLYREDHIFQGTGKIQQISELVDEEHDAGDYFTAQYDHLQTIGVYIDRIESAGTQADHEDYGQDEEGTLLFQLFSTDNGVNTRIASEYVTPDETALPGYVEILTDVDLEPGETYIYLVNGVGGASFYVGLESSEVSANPRAPFYQQGFYHDTSINGLAVATRLTYRTPLDKKHSVMLAAMMALAGLAVVTAASLFYQKHPARNSLTTLEAVMQYTLTPLAAFCSIFFLVCIWTQKFDERLSDNILYSIGVVLTLLIILFGLWHDRTGQPDMLNREIAAREWPHYMIAVCVALVLSCCTMYMNATYEELHTRAECRIVILMCIIALCMVHRRENKRERKSLRLWLLLPLAALFVWMLVFANGRRWIFVMAAVYVVLYLRFLFWKDQALWLRDLSWGILLHFAGAVVYSLLHRYYFAFIYSRFGMQFHTSTVTAYYLLIVGAAATAQVSCAYLRAYNEYRQDLQAALPEMARREAARQEAGKIFPHKNRRAPSSGSFVWYCRRLWKELVVFGCVCAYMLMTLSRAGLFELALFALLGVVLTGRQVRKREKLLQESALAQPSSESSDGKIRTGQPLQNEAQEPDRNRHKEVPELAGLRAGFGILGWMLLSVLVLFPAVFTNQRLVSTVNARPVWYEEVEPYPDRVIRHAAWNDKWFMSWEIFARDFGDRVIGGGIGSRLYNYYDWGSHQDVKNTETWLVSQAAQEEASTVTTVRKTGQDLSHAKSFYLLTRQEGQVSPAYTLDTGDYSNGRLMVWLSYLTQLNMTGHDTMGATLPDGSLAVHAHNNILQLAYDCGIPAGLLFLLVQVLIIIASGIYYNACVRNDIGKKNQGKAGIPPQDGSGDPAYMRRRSSPAMMQLLIVLGFTITGLVEWTWTFCNPFCIVYMCAIAPLLVKSYS